MGGQGNKQRTLLKNRVVKSQLLPFLLLPSSSNHYHDRRTGTHQLEEDRAACAR